MQRAHFIVTLIFGLLSFAEVGHVSTHVGVERKNEFFEFRAQRSFGKSVGGVDSTYGSNWVLAHEKLFRLLEAPVFSALAEAQKTEKIAVLPFSKETRSCSAWADRGIPTCRAQFSFQLDRKTLQNIEKSAPIEMLKGQNSIREDAESADDILKSSTQISLRAATGESELKVTVQYVADADPSADLAKRLSAMILQEINKDVQKRFPRFKP
jgi:hypothetical protein